jgi:hypothetical protein
VGLGNDQGFEALRCDLCGGAVKLGVIDKLKVKIAAHGVLLCVRCPGVMPVNNVP